ncbi:MAG: 23S rRNA (guanosine(2251)-2'-O)-methyltransferase RlmB [Clostridiales bacterium]|nr:23S rRNA (guanosine(2251)-2'-O)-methyltransferase RlmB [Clostridiales bacterium]
MPGPKNPRPGKHDITKFRGAPKDKIPSFDKAFPGVAGKPENAPTEDRVEGRNPVLEAMRAGRTINKLFVMKRQENARPDPTMSRIINMAKELRIPIMEVPKTNLDEMSQTHNHQGVIAQVASHEYVEIDEMLERANEKGEAPLLLILDELKDAYNLGSILRIADAAGVSGVIIPQHRSIGLDSMVAKASAGAIEYVPVARVTNLSRTILELKEKGFWIAGTDAEGTNRYFDDVWSGPMAIVIGSEGEGMNKNIRDKCDFLLSIPMAGSVNSLNAAVAAGIVVFEATKQRRKKDGK